MTSQQLAEEAIRIFNKRITNEIFLLIQKDKNLMHSYLKAVEEHGLDNVNQTIGKAVKQSYNLTNLNDREENPSCTLIQSHQKFK